MTNIPTQILVKKVTPLLAFQTCPNCYGYGAKGNPPRRITCPSCKGEGVLRVPVKEETRE